MNAPRIGLVAGWGRYPILVAETLQRHGIDVFCLGIKGHADPVLAEICHDFRPIGIAKLGAQIRYFRRHKITHATMAGKIFKHRVLYHGLGWIGHLPDWRFLRVGLPYFITNTKSRQDDTLLSAFVEAFAKDGIHFEPATDFVPELLVKNGSLTWGRPSSTEWKDIQFGWGVAKEIGRMDIGQTVVIKNQSVVAVEAIEGTDECIRRAGELCPQGGLTVVKVAKPQQDMRFDVPAIGVGTLKSIAQAGGRVLAIEAGKTIVIDADEVADFARKHGISVVAVDADEINVRRTAA